MIYIYSLQNRDCVCERKRRVVGVYEDSGVVLRELDGVDTCRGAPVLQAFPIVGVTGDDEEERVTEKKREREKREKEREKERERDFRCCLVCVHWCFYFVFVDAGVLAAQYLIDQLSLPLIAVADQSDGAPTAVVMKSQVTNLSLSLSLSLFLSSFFFSHLSFGGSLVPLSVCMAMRRSSSGSARLNPQIRWTSSHHPITG